MRPGTNDALIPSYWTPSGWKSWPLEFPGSVQHTDVQKVTVLVSFVPSPKISGMDFDEPSWVRGLTG